MSFMEKCVAPVEPVPGPGGGVRTAGANIDMGEVVPFTSFEMFPGGNIEGMDNLHAFLLLSNLIKYYQIVRKG